MHKIGQRKGFDLSKTVQYTFLDAFFQQKSAKNHIKWKKLAVKIAVKNFGQLKSYTAVKNVTRF